MFGAYQAGAWKALHSRFAPDIVIGASIGAMNGWAVASGVHPDELIDRWLHLNLTRIPDLATLHAIAGELCGNYRPVRELGVALTRLFPLRPELFRLPKLTPAHLVASCAAPFFVAPLKIEGRFYIDGGFLGALPLWAARQMGATHAVAVHVMAGLPGWWLAGAATLRWLTRYPRASKQGLETLWLAPPRLLGGFRAATHWDRGNVERWIEQGYRETEATIQTARSLPGLL
jgi:predicted acylesterase/phospholipase RssA